jgi:hypothetical protein
MKCEWVRQNIFLYVYDELTDDARFELERHLERCPDCATELKQTRDFHGVMSARPPLEPSPNLLAASRMRLQEALETAEQPKWWQTLTFDLTHWFQPSRFSPALAAAIFIVGFGVGIAAMYRVLPSRGGVGIASSAAPAQPQEASIAGIRAITPQADNKHVDIKYDTVTPQIAQGSLDDPRIQQLLMYAAHSNYNSGVRMDSIDLLSQRASDETVRQTLIYALRYDTNPGVRHQSLEAIGPFVKSDVRVRDAVLEALLDDGNLGVRAEAIRFLEPVRADSSVRQVLQQLSVKDPNQYIRSQSRAVLAETPEIN